MKCLTKKSKFIKEKDDSGLLGSLAIKTPLSKTLLLDHPLF